MPFGRSLLQRESLLRVSGEERSPEILISFHSSGSTSNQWRKLKNPWFPGRTPFRPSWCETGKKKRFFAQLAHSIGPTCISYLAEEASDRLEFLPYWEVVCREVPKKGLWQSQSYSSASPFGYMVTSPRKGNDDGRTLSSGGNIPVLSKAVLPVLFSQLHIGKHDCRNTNRRRILY